LLRYLLPDYWNKGLTTEAVKVCLKFGFEEKGFEKIIAITNTPNTASIRVMEKAGMKFLKRDAFHEQDSIFYSISREEFEESCKG
jgi:RimJ/RimL family protein N-acetyltransferase